MQRGTIKNLLEQQLKDEYAKITFLPNNGATPKQYLKWISYVPESWKIPEILQKLVADLTKDELSRLKHLKMEREIKPYFENFVSDKPTTSMAAYKVYEYMTAINLYTYVEMKLTDQERKYCYSQLAIDTEEEIREKIALLEDSENMADDFLVFLLKKKLACIVENKDQQKLKMETNSNKVKSIKKYFTHL